MKPWMPLALLLGALMIFIYLMSLVGQNVSD